VTGAALQPAPREVGGLVLRPLAGAAEYDACVALQRETWGDDFQEVVPPTILWVAQRIGGVAAGAFEGDRLLGFVFGLTGVEHGRIVHWSDMLAVRGDARGRGVGRLLKEYQRELLLPHGIEVIYWTFDPLEARNAHINFAHLGISARTYMRDVYGAGTSTLHAGLGTDRLLAEWWIREARSGRPVAAWSDVEPALPAVGDAPGEPRTALDAARVSIAVPADIQALKRNDPALARAWRATARAAFEAYLSRGYTVTGFRRGAPGYVLERD
jgi:chorismate synthase